ncbi:MAG TPA: zinc-binding alcohol dehydrogenase [Galbitalea sp.]|nr:zinc-binding alcohol dehydrogenase [Galbitalea sp.]
MPTKSGRDSFISDAGRSVAFWSTGPGAGELRTTVLPEPEPGEVRVRTLFTGVSRGTEALVARGEVPESEWERMRSPFQAGDFPFPVKYGYLNVGVVERGPAVLVGRTVFTLFPHQSAFVVAAGAVTLVPDGVPPRRAVLAGAVETAVNVLWDAAPRLGDSIAIVGVGMIGGAIAALAAGIPGVRVTVIDIDQTKRRLAASLGVGFARPGDAAGDYDVVIEASGTGRGLAEALRVAPTDGDVVVASWYGKSPQQIDLGTDFHSRRLSLRASQVGDVATARRGRRTPSQRRQLALRLLENDVFDNLLGDNSHWNELPSIMTALTEGSAGSLCHTIDWSMP